MDINYKKTLICILLNIISFTKYIIYLWYIDKNILINFKLLFNKKKRWQEFYNNWYGILYTATKPIFEKKWAKFQVKYETNY